MELDDDSIPLTAFTVGPLGFYECIHMPFGLTNAPATFQRLMESCLGELHLNWCIIYLDDIIIHSRTPEEHLIRLEGVFSRLRAAGLKLKPNKCAFFKDRIAYLGHIVSKEEIEVDPSKITAIQKWPRPKTVKDVRSFLGFTNYYRKFMHRDAQISKPLNDLTSGENAKRKKNKNVEWTDEHQESFDRLKNLSTSSPVLAYANYKKPFIVYTDASERGLGAVLSQLQDNGKESAITFASRSLSKSEKRYDAHKLEFLALKWAMTDQFHEYLYGGEFDVYTDNNPLTYVLTTAKLDATSQRWIAALALYHFRIYYWSGKMNANADALSRIPWEVSKTDKSVSAWMTVTSETIDVGEPSSSGEPVFKKRREDIIKGKDIRNRARKEKAAKESSIGTQLGEVFSQPKTYGTSLYKEFKKEQAQLRRDARNPKFGGKGVGKSGAKRKPKQPTKKVKGLLTRSVCSRCTANM